MPHILVEYTKELDPAIPFLLGDLHKALAGQGIDMARIKTRGHQINHAMVGAKGADGHMVHIILSLLAGRDTETKKKYGDALKAVLDEHIPAEAARTIEIRDMDPDTYYL